MVEMAGRRRESFTIAESEEMETKSQIIVRGGG
jgi:hypothetical protein